MESGKNRNILEKSPQKSLKISQLSEKGETFETDTQYLKGVKAVIIEQGLGKTRTSILSKQLVRHGGVEARNLSPDTTHVLVGNSTKLEKLNVLLEVKEISNDVKVVRADWLSACLREGRLVDLQPFNLRQSERIEENLGNISGKTQRKLGTEAVEDLSCETDAGSSGLDEAFARATDPKRPKLDLDDDGDSDYINSGDERTEEGSTESDDGDAAKPREISPHISPHKKVDGSREL